MNSYIVTNSSKSIANPNGEGHQVLCSLRHLMSAISLWRSTVTSSAVDQVWCQTAWLFLTEADYSNEYVERDGKNETMYQRKRAQISYQVLRGHHLMGFFLLYCIRLEISSKSDIRILDQTFIFVIYQNTIRRVHLQMGQFYKHVWGASSENRVNLITLIVKMHQTFVI